MSRPRLASILVVGALALAGAGCGGDDDSGSAETTTPPPATTEGGGTSTNGDIANGEMVFASAGCGGCHTFAAAGSSGTIGPNLDDLNASFDAAVQQVTNGGGGMPAFGGDLSEQEIRDVAAFVSSTSS
jgi:mono/diheme cytochrome c family protein